MNSLPGNGENHFPEVGEGAEPDDCDPLQSQATQPPVEADEGARSPAASQRTACKTMPKPPSQQEGGEAVKEEVAEQDDGEALEDIQQWDALKRRRQLPGAGTSDEDFAKLFARLQSQCTTFQTTPPEPIDTSDTILQKVHVWTEVARRHLPPAVPEYLVRVAVAVVAFGRVRQWDVFLREHALVYWIAEGQRTLRFHSGDCFMKTPSGAFQQHRGVPPDHDRVESFLMTVEGVFRKLSRNTARTAQGLIQALAELWQKKDQDMEAFIRSCLLACIDNDGEPSRQRGRPALPEVEAEDGAVEASVSWNMATAKTILVVKKHLVRELTEGKLLHYMTEWCDTPKQPVPSCCYDDCAILFDDGLPPARQVLRQELENCYLRVPHSLKQTVPKHILERLEKLLVHDACMFLALM